jgi:4-diphosphocytidyl-2-C-methyl-D-erythritol kinase
MEGPFTAPAPAKINLSLRVLGKRPDGFHELFGLMAKIGLRDDVRLSPAEGGRDLDELACEDLLGPPFGGTLALDGGFLGPENLALRAVRAFRQETGHPGFPVVVCLAKRVPLRAGLGGGSSDAAAVLRILNRRGLVAPGRLATLARDLGGDVPFFLEDGPMCWAGGIGERLRPHAGPRPGTHVVLVNPGLQVSTAAAFGRLGLTTGPGSSISLFAEPSFSPSLVPPIGHNDLEEAAMGLHPSLAGVKATIASVSPAPDSVGLSGSGPTFWALYGGQGLAARAARSLARPGWWVAVAPLLPEDQPEAE